MVKGVIRIIEGMLKGGEYRVDDRLTVGRNPENSLQLLCMRASRFHAVVEKRQDDVFWIQDLGSTSGTLVNGEMVTDRQLKDGDQLAIGDTTMQFHLEQREGRESQTNSPTTIPSPLTDKHITRISFDTPERPGATAELKMNSVRGLTQVSGADEMGQELQRLVKAYNALFQANQLISSEAQPESTYKKILHQLLAVVPADRGIIMVRDHISGELVLMASLAKDPKIDISHIRVSRTIVNKAMDQRVAVLTCDAMQDYQFARQSSIHAQNIRSAICAPLLYRDDEVLGVIYLDTQSILQTFDQDMLQLVTAVAGPAAIAIKNATYIEELKSKSEEIRQGYMATINVLTRSIEARDKYTIGHAWRVTRFALALAEALGWDEEQQRALEIGSLLHDVGKVGVEDAVLCKVGRLTEDEYSVMKGHPQIGARILKDVSFLQLAMPCIRSHHERWDGRGYPDGLTAEEIPVEGRILAIADAFDAMTSNRVYRKGMGSEKAVSQLRECAGSQFDPQLAKLFVALFEEGKVDYVMQNRALDQSAVHVLCPSCSTHLGLDDESKPGDRITCPVCHKELKLVLLHDQLVAQLHTSSHHTLQLSKTETGQKQE